MRVRPMNQETGNVGIKPIVHNVHILDSSLSMQGAKYITALKGINDELQLLKNQDEVTYTQTIVEFHTKNASFFNGGSRNVIHRHCFMKSLEDCSTIVGVGADGGTPLYETVGVIIEELLAKVNPGEKVLIKIFTDGEENTSTGKYAHARNLKTLIDQVEASHNFTVTFMGTKFDVEHMINNIGLQSLNTFVHDNTSRGIQTAYMASANSTARFSKSLAKGEYAAVHSSFFAEEQDEQDQQPILTKKP